MAGPGRPTPVGRRLMVDKRVRFRVFARCEFRCVYCGAAAKEKRLYVEHVIPKAKGGTDDEENLAAACFDCNVGKNDGIFIEAGAAAGVKGKALEKLAKRKPDHDLNKLIRSLGSPDEKHIVEWWVKDIVEWMGTEAIERKSVTLTLLFKKCSYPIARDDRRKAPRVIRKIGKPPPPSEFDRARLVAILEACGWEQGRDGETFVQGSTWCSERGAEGPARVFPINVDADDAKRYSDSYEERWVSRVKPATVKMALTAIRQVKM
jgi:hypothetical protein